jgi:hypothetical protein
MATYRNLETSALQSYAAVRNSYPNFTGRVLSAEGECRLPCKGHTKTLEERIRTMVGREEEKRIQEARRLNQTPYFSNADDIVVEPGEITVKKGALGFLKDFIRYAQKRK